MDVRFKLMVREVEIRCSMRREFHTLHSWHFYLYDFRDTPNLIKMLHEYTHETHLVHFFISKKYCNADNDYKWWMSLQFKKESVSLRTKIVQFNDDYGFVPTHDIHKEILLQSIKACELTICIYSNTPFYFLGWVVLL